MLISHGGLVQMAAGLLLLIQCLLATADSALEQHVVKVIDGDTVILADGQHVRLLGINTPELARRGKAGDPGGMQASQWLKRRIEGRQVRLEVGQEKRDRYGRLLAHLFDQSGEHINLALVAGGFATLSIIPPNLNYSKRLLAAQKKARMARRGLWGMERYQPRPLQAINLERVRGWQRLLVTPRALSRHKKSYRLVINDQFYLRVPRGNLLNFPDLDVYVGRSLEVRGWISKYRGRYSLTIRHPSALVLLEERK